MTSLWGDDFEVKSSVKETKNILNKITKSKDKVVSVEKKLSSKKISLEEKLNLIKDRKNSILD